MLTTHEKFRMIDENKQNEFFVEVNRNPKDPKSNECKLVIFTHPDGTETTVKREHLISMLFTFGTEDQQRNMIPQRITEQTFYKTVLGIKATKDIAKGEMINVPVQIPLPTREHDVIGSIKSIKNKYS